MLNPNCLMISGMITPTESVVMANIMNIRKVSALIAARLPPVRTAVCCVIWSSLASPRDGCIRRPEGAANDAARCGINQNRFQLRHVHFQAGEFRASDPFQDQCVLPTGRPAALS